jgi:hypothetical protein
MATLADRDANQLDHHGVRRMCFGIQENFNPIVGPAERDDLGATDDGAADIRPSFRY